MKRYKQYITNLIFTWNNPTISGVKLTEKLRTVHDLTYFAFQLEPASNDKTRHFQGYLEFKRGKRLSWLKNTLGKELHFEPRRGTQQEAINYCKKCCHLCFKNKKPFSATCSTLERIDGPWELGTPKASTRTRTWRAINPDSYDLPDNKEEQKVYIIHKIRSHEYKTLEDVYKVFPSLEWASEEKIKNLINKYNPLPFEPNPCPVIWLYGEPGAGKSTYTSQLLHEKGYTPKDVTVKKAGHEQEAKLWFELEDEGKKVIWLEEVRHDFPKQNKMIDLIDRRTMLEVKGSRIKPTYELIIVNSQVKPEQAYPNYLEVLRRIYDRYIGCQVLKVKKNEQLYRQLLSKRLPQSEWNKQYIPLVEDKTSDIPRLYGLFNHLTNST